MLSPIVRPSQGVGPTMGESMTLPISQEVVIMLEFKWKRAKGFVKRKKYGFCWGHGVVIRFVYVEVVLLKIRYKGWRVDLIRQRYGLRNVHWWHPTRRRSHEEAFSRGFTG